MARRLITILVFSLLVWLVAFAVLISGFGLAQATSDSSAATVLWWMAMGCLMLLVSNLLLLVVTLALRTLQEPPGREPPNDAS